MKSRFLQPRPSSKGLVFDLPLTGGFVNGGFAAGAKVQERTNTFPSTAKGAALTPDDIPIPAYPGFDFTTAKEHYIGIGAGPASVMTISLWTKPDDVAGNDGLIDLNGADTLSISTGTLTKTGFAGGTAILYTDAVAAATVVTAAWHHIAITDTNAKNATGLDIGRIRAGVEMGGIISEVRLYDRVLSAIEIKDIYRLQKWRYGV